MVAQLLEVNFGAEGPGLDTPHLLNHKCIFDNEYFGQAIKTAQNSKAWTENVISVQPV